MNQLSFQLFDKSADLTLLRCFADGKLIGQRELGKEDVQRFAQEVDTDYRQVSPSLPDLGRRLFEWLDGPGERWLSSALSKAGVAGCAIRIDVGEQLRHLPWELLFTNGAYLAAQANRPMTPLRQVSQSNDAIQRQNRPLRVLFMASSPEAVQPVLDFEKEEALILAATRTADLELVVEETGSLAGLRRQIEFYGEGYFDVVHLTGHADLHQGEPRFLLEDEAGGLELANAEAISAAFNGWLPRLIFLSGCRTGQAVESGALPSLSEALVVAGATAVLGWALPVLDQTGNTAAAELYHQLAIGKRLDEAVARTRQQLLAQGLPDWHLLRLYASQSGLSELVTAANTRQRAKIQRRRVTQSFLDAHGKLEVCPPERFVGRRRLLQRALRSLRSRPGDPDYAEGLLLHGMGGLGKSSLAARLCERMPHHQLLVWVGAIDEIEFLQLLNRQLLDDETPLILDNPKLDLEKRLRKLLDGPLLQQPALLIFDDFEQNLQPLSSGYAVKPAALTVLQALLNALHAADSESRLLVTSRYRFVAGAQGQLLEMGLESLRGADLSKKSEQLLGFAELERQDATLYQQALEVAAGNPRLLQRLDTLLRQPTTQPAELLAHLAASAADYREEIALRTLLASQGETGERMLALLAIYRLPLPSPALQAVASAAFSPALLAAAVDASLLEMGIEPSSQQPRYFVSDLVTPLLSQSLTSAERQAARRSAARYLYQRWQSEGADEELLLELHRLAMASGEAEIAAAVVDTLGWRWNNRNRFREAALLGEMTLTLTNDYRVLLSLARAQKVLGKTSEALANYNQALANCPAEDIYKRSGILYNLAELLAQQGEVKRALELWQQSLALLEQIGDVQGKAATLHNMAGAIAQQGEVKRALELWQQSLALKEQIGDVKGKAATLHQMAGVIAQQGEVKRALELWQQSLALKEQIGDVQGKAATLANMAWAAGQQGDAETERRFNIEAAHALAQVRAWLDLITVLGNLGSEASAAGTGYLAQALWLASWVQLPLESLLNLSDAMIERLGAADPLAALLATHALFAVQSRGDGHPNQEQLQNYAIHLLVTCAQAQGVAQEALGQWYQQGHLNDPDYVLPALRQHLQPLIGDGWLFDPRLFVGEAYLN